MPRAGLSEAVVVDLALSVVDETGPDFTLAQIAQRAGVATPSLYKHVDGLSCLRDLVAARVLDELSDAIEAATGDGSGAEATMALMQAYRRYAVGNPNRYALVPPQPLGRPELQAAANRLVGLVERAVGGSFEDALTVRRVRAVRSAAHGFASLETAGGFGMPVDLDASFELLSRAVVSGLGL